jgi:hypothetical protein
MAFKEKQFTEDLKKFGLGNIKSNKDYGINKILLQILLKTRFRDNYSEIEDRCAEISWMCSRMKTKILSYDPKWIEPAAPEGTHDKGLKQSGPGKRTVCAVVLRHVEYITSGDKQMRDICELMMWYTKDVFHKTLSRHNRFYDSGKEDSTRRDMQNWDLKPKSWFRNKKQ